MKITTKFYIGIILLALLTPIGLFLPKHFRAGAAWGEWGIAEIRNMAGYVPRGMERLAQIWNAPVPDYKFRGQEGNGTARASLSYVFSAICGSGLVVLVAYIVGRWIVKNRKG